MGSGGGGVTTHIAAYIQSLASLLRHLGSESSLLLQQMLVDGGIVN